MSFQAIRTVIEQAVATSISDSGDLTKPVDKIVYDNMNYVDNDATSEFVAIRVHFGSTMESSLSGAYENIRGSFVVEHYHPKGVGPGRSQEVMSAMMLSLTELNQKRSSKEGPEAIVRIRDMVGPSFSMLDDRPYFYSRISGGFAATYH